MKIVAHPSYLEIKMRFCNKKTLLLIIFTHFLHIIAFIKIIFKKKDRKYLCDLLSKIV